MNLNRSGFLIFLSLFFLTFSIVFFDQSKVVATSHSIIATSSAPFQILISRLRDFYTFWTDALFNIRELKLKNQELIQKNLELESALADISDLKSENESLKKQLNLANERTSQIRAIFDTGTKISSVTQISRGAGLTRGLGSDLILDLVPKSQDLGIDETIISSGQDGIWPKGLVVGKIAVIESGQNQIFKIAHLKSLIDWSRLEHVFIIIP